MGGFLTWFGTATIVLGVFNDSILMTASGMLLVYGGVKTLEKESKGKQNGPKDRD